MQENRFRSCFWQGRLYERRRMGHQRLDQRFEKRFQESHRSVNDVWTTSRLYWRRQMRKTSGSCYKVGFIIKTKVLGLNAAICLFLAITGLLGLRWKAWFTQPLVSNLQNKLVRVELYVKSWQRKHKTHAWSTAAALNDRQAAFATAHALAIVLDYIFAQVLLAVTADAPCPRLWLDDTMFRQ